MIEKARSSPCWAFRRMPGSGWARDKVAHYSPMQGRKPPRFWSEEGNCANLRGAGKYALSGHFGRRCNSEQVECRGHEVGKLSAVTECHLVRGDDERHRVRRVGRMRALPVGLEHLLGVAVVCCDEADPAG